jgi:5'-3' exonuclease
MGIKGLYSCLKSYAVPIDYVKESPCRLGLDAYPFLYRFKENIDGCMELFCRLKAAGFPLRVYMDGTPPKEKYEELYHRKQQRQSAYEQAKALRSFLEDEERSKELTEEARAILEKQIQNYALEYWTIKKEFREEFLRRCSQHGISVVACSGESDIELIRASINHEVDIVVANDMDLFVGGVERLWILGKSPQDPLFQEFNRSVLSYQLGIHPKAWVDVAILTGYEKCQQLKRCSAQQAICWIRYYGCLENLFARRAELLREQTLEEFQKARDFFV